MALQNLFHIKNEKRALVLVNKLKYTKMIQGEGVNSYLTRLSKVKDEFVVIGIKKRKVIMISFN